MRWLALLCGLLSLIACDDRIYGQPGGGLDPATVTSGYDGVLSFVGENCLGGCHGAEVALAGLDLETDLHLATVGVVGQYQIPIVQPGDPENSMFYLKITNTQPEYTGGEMPPGSGGVGEGITEIVYDWILDGASAE